MPHGFYSDKLKVDVPTQQQYDSLQQTVEDYYSILNRDKADIYNPVFTGTPKAPTAATGTKNTQIATTQFVDNFGRGLFFTRYAEITATQAGAFIVNVDIPTGFSAVSVWVNNYSNLEFDAVTLLRISATRSQVMLHALDACTVGVYVFCVNNSYL